MQQVPAPVVDDAQAFDEITAAKHEPRRSALQRARARVLSAYADYIANAPDVDHVAMVNFHGNERLALLHAYSVETTPMAGLRSKLMAPVILARCPLCGIGEATTLDHYLPKEQNPQYAVFSRNLVPCCSKCNTQKNDVLIDEETGIRQFLHPYFDNIPAARFVCLKVVLHSTAISLTYSIVKPRTVSKRTFEQLNSHFWRLGLADRYRIMSLEHLRSRRRALMRIYGSHRNAQRVADELSTEAGDYERDYGPNHWRAVLYRALASNRPFCDGGFGVLNAIQ